jgi:RNA polymerase sigma factor (sigma-70 family)
MVADIDLERLQVQAARKGDRAAMEALISAHADSAFRFALSILRNQADAEDATQAAFVKAFTNMNKFDERRRFGPWLLSIVYHEALNLLRADRTRWAFWQRQPKRADTGESVESLALVQVEHQQLWEALNRLKDDDRAVLILGYLMGYGEAETAEVLGVKRGTVKSRKHNALQRLRTLVEREFPGLKPEDLVVRTEGNP